jgi:hypothetical protein
MRCSRRLPLGRFAAPSSKAKVTSGVDDVVFERWKKNAIDASKAPRR